ncbi:MAG: hypothetical protein QOH79_284, partial [Acidimicrobiaceae bacterium]
MTAALSPKSQQAPLFDVSQLLPVNTFPDPEPS